MIRAGLPHPPDDRLRDDVARREIGQLVHAGHEPRTGAVDQVRALAAHRLGDQRLLTLGVLAEPHHGRVELHELEVPGDGTRAQRQRHAVTGGHQRVGRGGVDLAHAAGGEHHRARVDRTHTVPLALAHHVQGDPAGPPGVVEEQVKHERVLDDLDTAVGADGRDQRSLDLRSGRVAACVRDPVAVVAALPGERDLAVGRDVEAGAVLDEPPDRARAFGDEQPYRLGVAQAHARDERVLQMLLRRVPRAERGGDPALGPARRPCREHVFGDDQDLSSRPRSQRRSEPGDPGADDDDIPVRRPPRVRGEQPAGQWQPGGHCSVTASPRRVSVPGTASAGSPPVPVMWFSRSTKTTRGRSDLASESVTVM